MSFIKTIFTRTLSAICSLEGSEAGQGLAEYGLILALIAVLCAGALTALQGGLSSTLGVITSSL